MMFLYIVPLKQGLKPSSDIFPGRCNYVFIHSSIKTRIETETCRKIIRHSRKLFLYIVPLKQGLKLVIGNFKVRKNTEFLYIVPLKQGLKLIKTVSARFSISGFYT